MNFLKISFTPVKALILVAITIVLTAGGVHATQIFNEDIVINGKLDVNNGLLTVKDAGFKFDRTDNIQTGLRLINSDKQTSFMFEDPDDQTLYVFRVSPGPNGNVDYFDFSGANPVARVDISIKKATGQVGIGTQNPQEQLDVNGNIFLSGANAKILSNGDICIGAC